MCSLQAGVVAFMSFGRSLNGIMKAALFIGGIVFTIVFELKLLRFVIRRVVVSQMATPAKHSF